jgi:chemotaxis receptor (MCP) glutamine deamidase CheD
MKAPDTLVGQAPEVTLYIGGVHASRGDALIKTLLGSCIAVCLHDPDARVGGMNHFMLPYSADAGADNASRFGVHAMDQLIGATMKAGGDRRRFVAKVFGGAHVLGSRRDGDSVPLQNIDFVRRFLETEGFPVVSSDVGGELPRHVYFYTGSGRAFVKRVTRSSAAKTVSHRERGFMQQPPPAYGDVTLFE